LLDSYGLWATCIVSRATSFRPLENPAGEEASVSVSTLLAATTENDRKPTVIDDTHLERMTLGDRRLEREVLELFVRQTTILLGRIMGAEPGLAAAAAHTLKGSARGVGAWRVARAAELVENAATGDRAQDGRQGGMDEAVTELKAASLEASAAIGSRLTGLVAELARGR
jgi:HPt (histidine-containing phosphotransfer) domain-containing protein